MRGLEPAIIVIFGITGDLAQRKLLPALYHLFKDDLLDERTVILGITRRDVSSDDLLANVELCVNEIDAVCDPVALRKVQAVLRMHQMSQVDPAEYRELSGLLDTIEKEKGVCMNRLYYLSIPPQMFEPIVRNLGQQGLNKSCSHGRADTRLLIEKPFGYDLASARDLIQETAEWFSESQLFRIDHYLAKDTVQNIISFRSTSPDAEKVWNADYIEAIEITAYEKIDIEGRATFYEQVGALRDFIQSHLLQLLAAVAMELPVDNSSESIHAARLALLQSIRPIAAHEVDGYAKRGQYEGYREETHNPDTATETYASVQLSIANDRWKGLPVILQTGKAMAEKRTDVTVRFKAKDNAFAGQLVFHLQPDKGIAIEPSPESPKFLKALQAAAVSFNRVHPPAPTAHPDAYERVLLDAVRGDHTLFMTSDEVIAAWKIVDAVVREWSQNDTGLISYPKGAHAVSPESV